MQYKSFNQWKKVSVLEKSNWKSSREEARRKNDKEYPFKYFILYLLCYDEANQENFNYFIVPKLIYSFILTFKDWKKPWTQKWNNHRQVELAWIRKGFNQFPLKSSGKVAYSVAVLHFTLLDTKVYVWGIYFTLRCGKKHTCKDLHLTKSAWFHQMARIEQTNYAETISKNNPGGPKHWKIELTVATHFKKSSNSSWCINNLYKIYLIHCPPIDNGCNAF